MRNQVRRAVCATAMAGSLIVLATSSASATDQPASRSTTVLPETGASATLLLLLLVGLAALFGGLYMLRAERTAKRHRKERSRTSNHS